MPGNSECPIFIGICGKPGAGKDTIGGYVSKEYGFEPMTIKAPIEAAVKAVLNVDDHHLYDRDAREQPLDAWPGWTVRKALQGFAQALRDLVGEHLWSQSLCMRMGDRRKVVVTDVRTPGDVAYIRQYVKSRGGRFILWMVKRPGYGATTSGGFANHKLESYDLEPECDAVFNNDGTIWDLHAKVVDWMSSQGIRSLGYDSDQAIFAHINALVDAKKKGSGLDGLPHEERSRFCWCKPGQDHCGTCDCGKPGHVRSLGPATMCWCDQCYEHALRSTFGTSPDCQQEAKG